MAKTELTISIEKAIYRETFKQGTFGCFEVTIGWFGKERVDYMTYNTKGEFRCYEIKISKSDFYSQSKHTFVGHYNYYVMPKELYDEIKNDIPQGIGIYLVVGNRAYIEKRAKRKELSIAVDILKDSMIRSLSREVHKQILSENPLIVEQKNREISRLKRERDNYYHECWDIRKKYDPAYK